MARQVLSRKIEKIVMEYFKEWIQTLLEVGTNIYGSKWDLAVLIVCSVIIILFLMPRMFNYH